MILKTYMAINDSEPFEVLIDLDAEAAHTATGAFRDLEICVL
jgi:hypothetical protein